MLAYRFIYCLAWLITLLPLRVLYMFSDLMYVLMYYMVGYRKKVVRENMKNAFPEKSEKELSRIERGFYHYFCDLIIETLYEMNMSRAEVDKRITFSNIEGLCEQYELGKSVMVMTAHYGNWEWIINFPSFIPKDYYMNVIYRELSNKKVDKLVHELRTKYGAGLIEKKDLLRTMYRMNKAGQVGNFWMISDQTPNIHSIHYWTRFLNQQTAVVTGTETLARKFDYPVFYAEIIRVKRGYYHCTFQPVELAPKSAGEFEISEKYMRLVEGTIERQPEFWLWTHRRWKHTPRD